MKNKKFDPQTKVAIVLEGLKGNITVAELCRKYKISETIYYRWRDKFLEGGRKAFICSETNKEKELEKIIGRQTIQIEILKKAFQLTKQIG